MKLGMPLLYEFDNIEDNLILAKELELDFIELNLNFGYCRKEMEEGKVSDLLKKYNIEATLHFYDEADFASYDEIVNGYLSLLEKYSKLGNEYIKIINIHNNVGPIVTISGIKNYIYEKEYDNYINNLIKNLKKAEKICKDNNIIMVIENTNMPSYMNKTYKDLYKANFMFNFDIGHDNNDNDMILKIIKNIPLEFKEFHFHDGNRKTCHLSLLDGNMDLKMYKQLLIKYDPYVVLEVKQKTDLIKSVPIFKKL